MSPQPDRSADDRWRDAVGRHLPAGCRVEQVDVDCAHGALGHRLCQRGEVIGRGPGNRLVVRFDAEDEAVSIGPHLLRMLAVECVLESLEQLRALLSAAAGEGDGRDR